ncbi:Tfp pilus assembly protein FimT/FimU [Acinetobacter courvalinii]|uniref:pilus assembly FimT family protein n=1 Tax=Acinetobacter courvalinii TaxID=280147 RepID=UPI0039C8F71F
MGKTRGFTLIELMVTIAVLAVIAMMAAPVLTKIIYKSQLNNDARDFADRLVELRSDAVLKQKGQDLSLDENKAEAWKTSDHIHWDTGQPTVTTLSYDALGRLDSANNLCFVLVHVKDMTMKAVIIARKNGLVIFDKSFTACPTNLGNE